MAQKAIILHTLGVQVGLRVKGLGFGGFRGLGSRVGWVKVLGFRGFPHHSSFHFYLPLPPI